MPSRPSSRQTRQRRRRRRQSRTQSQTRRTPPNTRRVSVADLFRANTAPPPNSRRVSVADLLRANTALPVLPPPRIMIIPDQHIHSPGIFQNPHDAPLPPMYDEAANRTNREISRDRQAREAFLRGRPVPSFNKTQRRKRTQ